MALLLDPRTTSNNSTTGHPVVATTAAMTTPLLSSDHLSDQSDKNVVVMFPDEEARKVKFVVPKEWKSDSTTFHFEYKHGFLRVVSDDHEGQILDVIDPEDMIGASLVIEPRMTATTTTASSSATVGSRANNEPQSNVLRDRLGIATLTFFCYPRLDPSSRTWMNWLGFASYKPSSSPNPNYVRPDPTSCKWQRYAHFRSFVLQPTEDLQGANALLTAIKQMVAPSPPANKKTTNTQPLRYLVLVNPVSGPKRNGLAICETIVQPMLEQAGIEVDVLVTTHGGHAAERMAKTSDGNDLSRYQGLVLMGGDGIVFEALNGIMKRDDVESIRKALKLGVVGCGTSNGFVASVAYASNELYGPLTEAFLICKGQTTALDISRFETAAVPEKSYTSFLTYTYAMIADIDIESEAARWLGETRNDVWAVWRILFLRRYPARISYLPADRVPDRKTKGAVVSATVVDPVPNDWSVIEDDIILFWASHVSHAAMHTHQAPNAKFNDGVFRLFLIRGKHVSRFRLLLILLGLESGTHVGMPCTEFIDCCAFRLEPKPSSSGARLGRNVLDGELVEPGSIQGCVIPAMFQFFCRPQQ